MKCPRCWANKAYLYPVPGWKKVLLACLLVRPLKCRHCYHKFWVPLLFTIGKQVTPPRLRARAVRPATGASYAARHYAATRENRPRKGSRPTGHGSRKADAA